MVCCGSFGVRAAKASRPHRSIEIANLKDVTGASVKKSHQVQAMFLGTACPLHLESFRVTKSVEYKYIQIM